MTNLTRRLGACVFAVLPSVALAQRIPLPSAFPQVHPRIAATTGDSQAEVRTRLRSDAAAQAEVKRAEAELTPYLARTTEDPMWLASRLQMYWKTHATEIYNRGGAFDHVEGHAPVATVRYPGSRDPLTIYKAPEIADIPPYEDDTRGVFVVNGSLPEHPLEWQALRSAEESSTELTAGSCISQRKPRSSTGLPAMNTMPGWRNRCSTPTFAACITVAFLWI